MRATIKPGATPKLQSAAAVKAVGPDQQPHAQPLWATHSLQRAEKATEWAGETITISQEVLALLQGIFSPADAAHLRRKGKALQIDLRHGQPDDPFRWGLLKEIVQSGERLMIEISSTYRYTFHQERDGQIISTDTTEELPIDGVTLASRSLTRQTYGKLQGTTSQEEAVSAIYLRPDSASSNHLVHELLGHFYLDVRHIPSGHSDRITEEQGVLDPQGKPFTGRVHDLIEQHIELDSERVPYDPIFYE